MHAPERNTTHADAIGVDVVWCPRPGAEVAELRLTLPAGTTVRGLAEALGCATDHLVIDGRRIEGGTLVVDAGIVRGAHLSTTPGPNLDPAGDGLLELAVVAGMLAGRRFGLSAGTMTVGRAESCDIVLDVPSVSAQQATIRVQPSGDVVIEDLDSTNGTWVDGVYAERPTPVVEGAVVRMGALALQVQRRQARVALTGPSSDGTAAFNRPPRITGNTPPVAVLAPAAAPEPAPRARLPWAALIAPLVLGLGMAVLYDPRFAAFALFSPAMMLGTWVEDRRRARREAAANRATLDDGLEQLRNDMAAAGVAEQHRRRAATPTAGLCAAVAEGPDPRLWERRPEHDDFLHLALGLAQLPWRPPVAGDRGRAAAEAERLLSQATLADVPLVVELRPGSTCGISGEPAVAAALARNLLLQVAALHGPADVRVAIFTEAARLAEWEWAKWLPHTASETFGRPSLATTSEDHQHLAESIREHDGPTVVVVDHEPLLRGRNAAVRSLLSDESVAGLVLVGEATGLPSVCTTVLDCTGEQGVGRCSTAGAATTDVLLAGAEVEVCRTSARRLARVDDPERDDVAAGLPERVSLLELLSLDLASPDALLRRWESASAPRAVIGVTDQGPLELDLVADGPHGLIAGTTGAGKSELLRSIVAGLAANLSPQDLNFVLIDYKGGSAFDACAGLPHTVGMVTDLDEALGRRALRCLEAELRYRERLLRDAGAVDLKAYRALPGSDRPLPRLLVAVDEFATLAAEMPDFIDKLVSVAQRGRSLGVHLLLATQRPAGAVSDHIRANTNMRIALRLHDAADSHDVIGVADAATLHRTLPGRGYLRLGPSDLTAFQAALVSAGPRRPEPGITVEPFSIATRISSDVASSGDDELSDLQRLVDAACTAYRGTGLPLPRRPWPEPLPATIRFSDVQGADGGAVIGIADDPDNQRWVPLHFDPAAGSMALYGALGSGPTDALATIVAALAGEPNVHCYILDAGRQSLAALDHLPHVGGVINAGDRERQERLVRYLSDEVASRRARTAAGEPVGDDPILVVAIDNYAALAAGLDDLSGLALLDELGRVIADGPALGVTVVVTADRLNAIPLAIAATIRQRLLFALPDRCDYAQFGLAVPEELSRNRGVDVASGLLVQIAEPPADLDGVAVAPGGTLPRPIGVLPVHVPVAAVADSVRTDGDEWFLPLGIDDRTLRPTGWLLGPGDHGLITGPARSGKSTALAAIAELVAKLGTDVAIHGVALRRSPLRNSPYLDSVATAPTDWARQIDRVAGSGSAAILLLDDADALIDDDGRLAALLSERRDNVWCIAAGRADVLRTMYGHFTNELRRSRCGLALRPNVDLDGDLWHTPLPRRQRQPFGPGRGYVVADGEAVLVQAVTL